MDYLLWMDHSPWNRRRDLLGLVSRSTAVDSGRYRPVRHGLYDRSRLTHHLHGAGCSMSEPQSTPGPWTSHDNSDGTTSIAQSETGLLVAVIYDVELVDLHLITAAPEMKALLDEAREACRIALESSEGEHGGGWTHVNDALRAVLAKEVE
jgi:hypothetical protein